MEKADIMIQKEQKLRIESVCRIQKMKCIYTIFKDNGAINIMNYHNLTYPDMNNGTGLRVALWLSGCSHHCFNCQNPQTWNPESGIFFDENAKRELFNELKKDYISGITITGGDPLYENNLKEIYSLIEEIRFMFSKKNIWIYTGYTWEEIFNRQDNKSILRQHIVENCDVIVDGRYVESQRDIALEWRGSKNQRVIDIKKSINKGEIIIWN